MSSNESQKHVNEKERIIQIAKQCGITAANEVSFPAWSEYHQKIIPYQVDCYLYDYLSNRSIVVEVDGYKGHDSRSSYLKDTVRREEDIRNMYGNNIEFFRFRFWELKMLNAIEFKKALDLL